MSKIAKLIIKYRKDNEVTALELANRLGYKSGGQMIHNIEKGKCKTPLKIIKKLADILGEKSDYLMELAVEERLK